MKRLHLQQRWFEDIPVGEFHVLGSHTFSELELIEFALKYDPRPQFTDPVEARETRWKGLIATPWLVAVMWMRKMVDYMEVSLAA